MDRRGARGPRSGIARARRRTRIAHRLEPLLRTRDSALVLSAGRGGDRRDALAHPNQRGPALLQLPSRPAPHRSGERNCRDSGTRHEPARGRPNRARRDVAGARRPHLGVVHVEHHPLPRESIQDVAATIRTVAAISARVRVRAVSQGSRVLPRTARGGAPNARGAPPGLSGQNAKWSSSASRGCCRRDRSLHAARRARHVRFRQYARGEEVNVWLIPPVR